MKAELAPAIFGGRVGARARIVPETASRADWRGALLAVGWVVCAMAGGRIGIQLCCATCTGKGEVRGGGRGKKVRGSGGAGQ